MAVDGWTEKLSSCSRLGTLHLFIYPSSRQQPFLLCTQAAYTYIDGTFHNKAISQPDTQSSRELSASSRKSLIMPIISINGGQRSVSDTHKNQTTRLVSFDYLTTQYTHTFTLLCNYYIRTEELSQPDSQQSAENPRTPRARIRMVAVIVVVETADARVYRHIWTHAPSVDDCWYVERASKLCITCFYVSIHLYTCRPQQRGGEESVALQ